MPNEPEPSVTLPWLVRLRWLSVLGQAIAIALADRVLQVELATGTLAALVLLAAASNLALVALARRLRPTGSASAIMGGVLTFDTLLLSALLAASGGPMNPFTVFYLVNITLSALVLSTRWTLLVAALSIAGFGALFLLPTDLHAWHRGPAGMVPHLHGMWVAFGLAALLTTFFVGKVTRAIAAQREQIAALREAGARNARLAAITTLAAGAAHELGSPLGTIAIAAHDARLSLERLPEAQSAAEDLALISLEVERCQEILSSMAGRAARAAEDAAPLGLGELIRSVRAQLGDERSARVEFRVPPAGADLDLPPGQTIQSVVALVRNGLDASPAGAPIVVEVRAAAGQAHISVADRGVGIPAALLPRVGEPFFTTKQPGRGLGLGVFLVRAFVESRGGELDIESAPGQGTLARMRIPLSRALGEAAS